MLALLHKVGNYNMKFSDKNGSHLKNGIAE